MPRLAFLDRLLPVSIPLVVPQNPPILAAMRELGVLRRDRQWLVAGLDYFGLISARRVFFAHSPDHPRGPPLTVAGLHAMASSLRAGLDARFAARGEPPVLLANDDSIVVLRRRGERRMANHDAVVANLTARFSPRWRVVEFEPGSSGHNVTETLEVVSRARLVIGPHGANMANLMALPAGAAVIELGFLMPFGAGFSMPEDFAGLSRVLGLRYFTVFAPQIYYEKPWSMDIDIGEALDIAAHVMDGAPLPAGSLTS